MICPERVHYQKGIPFVKTRRGVNVKTLLTTLERHLLSRRIFMQYIFVHKLVSNC